MKLNWRPWPKDAETTLEKVLYVLLAYVVPFAYFFMQLSAWQVFKNYYQAACKGEGFGFWLLGFALSVFTVGWTVLTVRDSNYVTKSPLLNTFIILLAGALSLLAYAGFTG